MAKANALVCRDSREEEETDTDVPPPNPTIIPVFDIQKLARDAETPAAQLDDLVFEPVPNVSWSNEKLDLTEQLVISNLDGVAPLALLATLLDVSREDLHPVVSVLRARGLIRTLPHIRDSESPSSGIFPVLRREDLMTELRKRAVR